MSRTAELLPHELHTYRTSVSRYGNCPPLSAAPALKLERDKPREQSCRIELADDGLNVGETAREWMQRNDVALADGRQSHEAEVD